MKAQYILAASLISSVALGMEQPNLPSKNYLTLPKTTETMAHLNHLTDLLDAGKVEEAKANHYWMKIQAAQEELTLKYPHFNWDAVVTQVNTQYPEDRTDFTDSEYLKAILGAIDAEAERQSGLQNVNNAEDKN